LAAFLCAQKQIYKEICNQQDFKKLKTEWK